MKGFLGYQPIFMIDLVLVSQILILPLLALALYCVKKHHYRWHSRIMVLLTIILLIAVILFETEIRLNGGMKGIAAMVGREAHVTTDFFRGLFFFHLLICGLTAPLWLYILYKGIKSFGFQNPAPTAYGATHKKTALIALGGAFLIALSGAGCYYLAFVS